MTQFKIFNMVKLLNPALWMALIAIATPSAIAFPITAPFFESAAQPAEITKLVSATKTSAPRPRLTDLAVLQNAFRNQVSNIQVLVLGRVISILPDDTNGDRHQRFIVRLSNSQTLLIAHNIDIAPRVSGLRVGDQVYVYGEYEWNSQGGVIHWTHHDPNGQRMGGWIQLNGTVFR